jgi:hypothetical protein
MHYIYTHRHTCIYIYTYTHTYTHTHIPALGNETLVRYIIVEEVQSVEHSLLTHNVCFPEEHGASNTAQLVFPILPRAPDHYFQITQPLLDPL